MMHLFLDESGDLGFKEGSSDKFLFTIALCKNKRKVEKVIKKVHKGLRKKYRNVNELHAYHANNTTRRRVLRKLSELEDLQIFSIILNKEKVYVDLQNQKNYLYNYTANILLDRLHDHDFVDKECYFNLCIDQKHTNKNLKDNFENYLKESLKSKRSGNIDIAIKHSHDEKSLQAVDFISWAIFRKYELGDFEFYSIIEEKIIEEKLLFP